MDHWRHMIENLPYVGLMAADQRNRPYITRLLEQAAPGILVGIAVAAMTVWRSDAVQDNRIENNSREIVRINGDMQQLKAHMDSRFDNIERKIDYSIGVGNLNNYNRTK